MPANTERGIGGRAELLAFPFLALSFYLNDFLFIAFNGTYGVYLTDYATRLAVLFLALLWPVARVQTLARPSAEISLVLCLAACLALPVASRLFHHLLEVPIYRLIGDTALFHFHRLDNPMLYWADLSFGLFLVALSEELVFRKLAVGWLERFGRPVWQIVLIAALLFSLMHWGSGVGRLAYTFVGGAIYTVAFLKLRRLWPLVVAHWIEDFVAFGPV